MFLSGGKHRRLVDVVKEDTEKVVHSHERGQSAVVIPERSSQKTI